MSATEHSMMTIKASAVSDITKICLKIDADKIVNDIQRRQIPRFADAPIGSSTSDCIENLQKEANFELFNWLKDFKVQDMSLLTELQHMTNYLNEIQIIGSLSTVDFKTSFGAVYDRQVIEEELKVHIFLLTHPRVPCYLTRLNPKRISRPFLLLPSILSRDY